MAQDSTARISCSFSSSEEDNGNHGIEKQGKLSKENAKKSGSCYSSSDSSSDSDTAVVQQPVNRKKTVRGFHRNFQTSNNASGDSESVKVYSGRVTTCFNALKEGRLQREYAQIAKADSDIEEEDKSEAFREQKKEPQVSATRPARRAQKRVSISISSDEDIEESPTQKDNVCEIRSSPSPPPPSPSCPVYPRRPTRRMKKGVKKSLQNLDNFKRTMISNPPPASDTSMNDSLIEIDTGDREMFVKIRSRSGIQRFPMKQSDTFDGVIVAMARHEGVPRERIIMYLNDKELQAYETCNTVQLKFTDIIECHITKADAVYEAEESFSQDDPSLVRLIVQGREAKSKVSISIKKMEPLEKLMRKYASMKKTKLESVNFYFDGDELSRTDTADSLDMEDGDCIDVISL